MRATMPESPVPAPPPLEDGEPPVPAPPSPEEDGPKFGKRRLLHPANLILLAIGLAFAAWEIVAAVYDDGPMDNAVTLSEYVWWAIEYLPWVSYPVVGGFLVWLTLHFFTRKV